MVTTMTMKTFYDNEDDNDNGRRRQCNGDNDDDDDDDDDFYHYYYDDKMTTANIRCFASMEVRPWSSVVVLPGAALWCLVLLCVAVRRCVGCVILHLFALWSAELFRATLEGWGL